MDNENVAHLHSGILFIYYKKNENMEFTGKSS